MTKRRPEYWNSPAILWFLNNTQRNEPEGAIKERARSLISDASIQYPPTRLNSLFPLRKIITSKLGNIEALSQLLPVKGGFSIILNKTEFQNIKTSHGRYRFSIAHEIGHTFFYNLDSTIPTRPERDSGSRAEERLCDIFATELLMPEQQFRRDCMTKYAGLGTWCKTLIEIYSLYEVSMEALIRRVLELSILENVVIVKWRYKARADTSVDKKLRVELCLPIFGGKYRYLWNDRPAPENSIFYQALNEDHVIRSEESFALDRIQGKYKIEAIRYKTIKNGGTNLPYSVLSIIWLK